MPVLKLMAVAVVLAFAGVQPGHAQDPSVQSFQDPNANGAIPPPLSVGANSFAEGQARSLIESKGFSRVSTLVNDRNGIWRGTAVKDDREVEVSVDFKGRVAAQ